MNATEPKVLYATELLEIVAKIRDIDYNIELTDDELLELVRKIRDIDYNIELTDDDKSNRILSLVADAYRLGHTDADVVFSIAVRWGNRSTEPSNHRKTLIEKLHLGLTHNPHLRQTNVVRSYLL